MHYNGKLKFKMKKKIAFNKSDFSPKRDQSKYVAIYKHFSLGKYLKHFVQYDFYNKTIYQQSAVKCYWPKIGNKYCLFNSEITYPEQETRTGNKEKFLM